MTTYPLPMHSSSRWRNTRAIASWLLPDILQYVLDDDDDDTDCEESQAAPQLVSALD